jgi:hypothetical protein
MTYYWTNEEIQYLKDNVHKYFSIKEYQNVHPQKRTYNSIKTKMKRLNLNCKNTKHPIGFEYFILNTVFVKIKQDAIMDNFYGDGWKPKWKIIWEEQNGQLPKNSVCLFIDNNPRNVTFENIRVISKGVFNRLVKSGFYEIDNQEFRKTIIEFYQTQHKIEERIK